jgi:hypothetical protein
MLTVWSLNLLSYSHVCLIVILTYHFWPNFSLFCSPHLHFSFFFSVYLFSSSPLFVDFPVSLTIHVLTELSNKFDIHDLQRSSCYFSCMLKTNPMQYIPACSPMTWCGISIRVLCLHFLYTIHRITNKH